MVVESDFAQKVRKAQEENKRKREAKPIEEESAFALKVKALRANKNGSEAPKFDADLIPELEHERTAEDDQIDSLIDGLDIVEAYRRYIGKMEPKVGGRRESIMISCPMPGHEDKNPSAWASLNKNAWYCAVCDRGGDQYDLAAIKFGFDLDRYKRDGSFPELRRQMAEDLGYVVRHTPGGHEYIEPIVEEPPPDIQPTPADVSEAESDPVVIPWEHIILETTFLAHWMEATQDDDLPEEFYFWLGLMAVGFAGGNDIVLKDVPLVKSNLFVCLFGSTGMGKTRAIAALVRLLRKALPYDEHDFYNAGVSIVPSPGSAEALIDAFSKPEYDPTSPKDVLEYHPVKGLLRFDELSTLTGRAGRSGSTMKPILQEFYDSYHPIDIKSRGAGHVKAEGYYCSTVTSTQLKAVRNILSADDTESGFINRWVFVLGREKKRKHLRKQDVDVDSMVMQLQSLRSWARLRHPDIRQIGFDEEADKAYKKIFEETLDELTNDESRPIYARIDLTLKKIMLILALNEKREKITHGIVERAFLLFPYLNFTCSTISGQIGSGLFEECRGEVQRIVTKGQKKKLDGLTLRDISRSLPQHIPRDLLIRVVKTMVDIEELSETAFKPAGRGRPTRRYKMID